ncbi:hypothetical protein AC578_7024 [Pseudocercospora eumusae]|uniref:Amino acid permease/ SLC12A domain-containing protein n=1 Tax=Pseudocercospora eumusae TaxID=321146 RepID=A0A139HCM1_9PEZI|nr:hypothetical protein AC578_7024 [Pseudocercospora eumusae]KXT00198.1 hypothetical protein AC578_7024 [Pseudocercospora eumusae]
MAGPEIHVDSSEEKKHVEVVNETSLETGMVLETTSRSDGSKDDVLQETDRDAFLKAQVNHRRLNPRQIQLASIAGSIGAALFVAIAAGVPSGPVCLLFAFLFWMTVVLSISHCQAEIVTMFPLDGSFIRLAGRMVDPALGVAAGWNYFFSQTSYVIFEATIINTLVAYWGYDKSPAILITVSLIFYLSINVYRADLFGEAEFWLALGKILLALGLIMYTLVTMLGGNPLHDRYGFRYWKDPGPWAGNNSSERLISWLNAMNVAGFCMGGPEYISMIAGEAKDPRRTIPRAFRTIVGRLMVFFVGGGICVGILVPSNEPLLTDNSHGFAGRSPYVISMHRLKINVLPSIVTAALLTSITSAGNAYTFNASRSLHALALEGHAPKILRRVNKRGTPYLAVIAVITLCLLAYLSLGSGSAKVLNWLMNFCTAATMFNWTVMGLTWIRFNAAMKAQCIDRDKFLIFKSRWMPFAGYWAFGWAFLFLWLQGYAVFLKGKWAISTFIFNYGIIGLAALIGIGWKIVKRTKVHRAKDIDLASDLDFFETLTEHYRHLREDVPMGYKDKIMAKIF